MKKRITSIILALVLTVCGVSFQNVKQAAADGSPGVYQVNGKYSLSKKQLITKCRLETAFSGLKKKTRTFKITPNTKFYYYNKNEKKIRLKGKKLTKKIKKVNKKNITFQFKLKKGRVLYIAFFE